MEKITVDIWKHIPARATVPDGYGNEKTAPAAPGLYTLWELADDNNTHQGWEWEKEAEG